MTFRRTFKKGDRVRCGTTFGYFERPQYHGVAVITDDAGNMLSVALDDLRHAPVNVVGFRPALRTTCPDGHPVSAVDAEKILPGDDARRVLVRVVACGFCDFIEEIKK